MTSGLILRRKKNKNAVLRFRQNRTSNINKQKDGTIYLTPWNSDSCRLGHIEVISNDDDPESVLLSLKSVSDCFSEGITVYNSGQIHVYLCVESTFLDFLEDMAPEKQRGLLGNIDVLTGHKTFLLYQNKQGNTMVLPKNLNFIKAFAKLEKEICNRRYSKSNVRVVLKDIVKCAQKGTEDSKEKAKEDAQALLQNGVNESHVKQPDLEGREHSLKSSKEKTFLSKKKLLIAEQGIPHLPQLTAPIPARKIFFSQPFEERLKLPMQVSAEQRDDELDHSEQVVSPISSYMPNSSISYGFNSSAYSTRSNAMNDHQAYDRSSVQPRYANFSEYVDRLITYSDWPHSSPDRERLSQAGFFYTKTGDLVRCYQCGIGLKDFSPDDDPLLEHIRHSDNCEFLPKLLGEERLSEYKVHLQATDPEYNRRLQWHERQSSSASRTTYQYPEYESQQSRISSFAHWPSQNMAQTPERMADAGLFYTGFEDHVRCFACGGGLRRWDLDDDPWTEHCRWFPACPFAIEQKGEQFIALVQAAVENQGSEASGGMDGLESAVAQLQLRESEVERIAAEHIDVILEMGYTEEVLKKAVKEFIERGTYKPALDDIIDLIEVIREREQTARIFSSSLNESPIEENIRLKSIVFCLSCGKNNINALFLPCTHHNLCMSCAEHIDKCPVCHRSIREKIRTYMV